MKLEDVFGFLCVYDKRNPCYTPDDMDLEDITQPRNGCYCDNCFYGRDQLALEILAQRDALKAVSDSLAGWMEIADPEDVRDYDEKALVAARAFLCEP